MAIAYKFIWLFEGVARIKANICVLCDNAQYEISKSRLQLKNDKWDKVKERILEAMQFELRLMPLNDYLIKEEKITPIAWKAIGNSWPKYGKTIAKAFELHDGIRRHQIIVIEVVI